MSVPILAPLEGEILGPADAVTVIALPHPFRAGREVLTGPAGASIAELVALADASGSRKAWASSYRASIGSDEVPADLWPRVRLKPGAVLLLRAVPRGGGAGLLRSIAMIFVAILTAVVAPYLLAGLTGFALAIGTAPISLGDGLRLNALFPTPGR